jgi:hypothetical protein
MRWFARRRHLRTRSGPSLTVGAALCVLLHLFSVFEFGHMTSCLFGDSVFSLEAVVVRPNKLQAFCVT